MLNILSTMSARFGAKKKKSSIALYLLLATLGVLLIWGAIHFVSGGNRFSLQLEKLSLEVNGKSK